MELDKYQEEAGISNALLNADPLQALNAALFGLASETGSLLDIQKKVLTDSADPSASDEQFKQELGDLLWYVSRVANAKGFSLQDIADSNLVRVRDMWEPPDPEVAMSRLPVYDSRRPPTEQFPRRMVFEFVEGSATRGGTEHLSATMTMVAADPYCFPDGPISRGAEKFQGFSLPQELGAGTYGQLTQVKRLSVPRRCTYCLYDHLELVGHYAVSSQSETQNRRRRRRIRRQRAAHIS